MGKIMILTLNDYEEMAIERIVAALSDEISIEVIHPNFSPMLSSPGLEIKQQQRMVLQDGAEINLTRLEYSTLVFLASNPGIVLTQTVPRRNKVPIYRSFTADSIRKVKITVTQVCCFLPHAFFVIEYRQLCRYTA